MARKNIIYSFKMFDSQVVSADATSPETSVAQLDNASIDLSWSASTLVAEVKVQVRNGDNASWRDLAFANTIDITGASGSHEILLLTMPFTDLRLFVDVASGSGTINAVITSKTVGA